MKFKTLLLALLCSTALTSQAQITDRKLPAKWSNLVEGGTFKDRFLPMKGSKLSSDDAWGAACVKPRFIDNGVENKDYSYWGGNILQDKNGMFHMYVCGWKENTPKGHMSWAGSDVFHATAKKLHGPYSIQEKIGHGHNPEAFVLNGGRIVIYRINGCYIADSYDGPWEKSELTFNTRDRKIIEGLSNFSFCKREDGSFIAVCRGGGMWISKDGISPYNQVTDERVYPPVDGRFEDPVIWKDHVQYHLIVNDWYGRIAWYLRSKDGVNWITDDGVAYEPGIAVHPDGRKEDWFKYERLKVFQDEYGRAIQANFAVIDTLKHYDLPNDIYSSKNITIPLNPGLLLSIENEVSFTNKPNQITLRVRSEKAFNPQKQMDLKSIRFGLSKDVDYGKGFAVASSKKDGKDLILTFNTEGLEIPKDEFALKLIAKDKKKQMIYGYTRLPNVEYNVPILSAQRTKEVLKSYSTHWTIRVENFGQVSAENAKVYIKSIRGDKTVILGEYEVGTIDPYQSKDIEAHFRSDLTQYDRGNYEISVQYKDEIPNKFTFTRNK